MVGGDMAKMSQTVMKAGQILVFLIECNDNSACTHVNTHNSKHSKYHNTSRHLHKPTNPNVLSVKPKNKDEPQTWTRNQTETVKP